MKLALSVPKNEMLMILFIACMAFYDNLSAG